MTLDKEALLKLAKKRQYKLRGIVVSFDWQRDGIGQLIVSKGAGANKKMFCFSAFGNNALTLAELKKGFRIKIWFTIRTKQFGEKWFTNLVVESFEHWIVNEEKVKKQQRIDEMKQAQKSFDWGNENF